MSVKLTVVGRSDVGKVRTNNEDTFVIADLSRSSKIDTAEGEKSLDVPEQGMLLAVSDGMGGEQAGEVASALVVESLQNELKNAASEAGGAEFSKIIDTAVAAANRDVMAAAQEPGRKGMGATLTAAFLHKDTAYIAEVGDSRAYLIRGHRIRQMTKDQSFVQLLLDAGAISADEAKSYPHKNVILQAMGQRPDIQAAIGKLTLRRDDQLLLCSDGLSNKVQDSEMRDVLDSSATLEEACGKLIAMANERGGEDNVTVLLARVSGDDLVKFKGDESVTQTFEIVRDFAQSDSSSKTKAAEDAEHGDAKKAKPAEATPAEAADQPEDDEKEKEPPPIEGGPPGDLSTRPQQMVVAVIMIIAIGYLFYTLVR